MDDAKICSTPKSDPAAAKPAPRYWYWTTYSGGDRERPFITQIPEDGLGTGYYTRWEGDHANGLLRFDRWEKRGAYLDQGSWRPSELVERLIYLGSDDGMDDINADEAQRIATDMGFPHALEDPLVLNRRWR